MQGFFEGGFFLNEQPENYFSLHPDNSSLWKGLNFLLDTRDIRCIHGIRITISLTGIDSFPSCGNPYSYSLNHVTTKGIHG